MVNAAEKEGKRKENKDKVGIRVGKSAIDWKRKEEMKTKGKAARKQRGDCTHEKRARKEEKSKVKACIE